MASAFSRGKVLKVTGVALGIGALSALTAGLAAPAFAAGVGALGIAGTSGIATFLGSAGGAASLASVFGASSASLSGWKYSRRIADIRVFEFVPLASNHAIDSIFSYISEAVDWTDGHYAVRPMGISHLLASHALNKQPQPPLHIAIGVSGWLRNIDEATKPWVSPLCCFFSFVVFSSICSYDHMTPDKQVCAFTRTFV